MKQPTNPNRVHHVTMRRVGNQLSSYESLEVKNLYCGRWQLFKLPSQRVSMYTCLKV